MFEASDARFELDQDLEHLTDCLFRRDCVERPETQECFERMCRHRMPPLLYLHALVYALIIHEAV